MRDETLHRSGHGGLCHWDRVSVHDTADGGIVWDRNNRTPSLVKADPLISVRYDVFWELADATRERRVEFGDPEVTVDGFAMHQPGVATRWRFADRTLVYVTDHYDTEHDAYLLRWPD